MSKKLLQRSVCRCSATAIALAISIGISVGSAFSQEKMRDPFANAPTGRLSISVELKGAGRRDLPNKVEWSRLKVGRKLEVELAMLVPGASTVPAVKVGGITRDDVQIPVGMQAIGKVIAACGEDESCRARAMTVIGQRLKGNPGALGELKQDDTRYENWIPDRRGVCATGTITVEDEGDGVNIAPPAPAAPYRFRRSGKLTLPVETAVVIERLCRADVTVDRQSGLLSLRVGAGAIPVPVRLEGQAFTNETSVPFREGGGDLEILDQKIDPQARSWQGAGRIEKAGSVSHNSGSVVAPVAAAITWRFVRN
ncbi:hypothetical protein GGD66_005135 [Bradyrhizobium sp. CIR48]|uniref:hypothetical protein n=1 Tax=unclassified Bradyrhizobium TaxID=2631580 RepID=UPI001160C4C9|nr:MULTISPECIES: hypothetical protein [unclassified Bradyrhizobium]MBB4378437.1 hypothetical protein [Bradyrhizobium sp. SBR1B]MBB4426565.1 hypothetical protein [Bradyrhizobium sp. CIR48]